MALPTFDNEEDIPTGFSHLYEEVDGKWPPKEIEDGTSELKVALDKERGLREKAEKERKVAEVARKEAERLAEADKAGLKSEELKALRDDIRSDLSEEFQGQLDAKDTEIADMKGVGEENRSLKLDQRVKAAMLANGVRGDRVDALFSLKSMEFDLTEDGQPKLAKHPGKTVEGFIKDDLKKAFPEFYKGTKASGSGAHGAFNVDGSPISGTTAEDVLSNPAEALTAARSGAQA